MRKTDNLNGVRNFLVPHDVAVTSEPFVVLHERLCVPIGLASRDRPSLSYASDRAIIAHLFS